MVYVVHDGTEFVKIGFTDDIEKRLTDMQIGNPRKLFVLYTIECDGMTDRTLEDLLHKHLQFAQADTSNKTSEWFLKEHFDALIASDLHGLCDVLGVDRHKISFKKPIEPSIKELAAENKRLKSAYNNAKRVINDLKVRLNNCDPEGNRARIRELVNEVSDLEHALERLKKCDPNTWMPARIDPAPMEADYLVTVIKQTGETTVRIASWGNVRRKGEKGWRWRINEEEQTVTAWTYLPTPYLDVQKVDSEVTDENSRR